MTVVDPTAAARIAPATPAATGTAGAPATNTVVSQAGVGNIHNPGPISTGQQPNLPPESFAPPGLKIPGVANGPANDAYQLLAAITGSNKAQPQQLLAALSNQAGSTCSAIRDVHRHHLDQALGQQIEGMSANERSQAIARLGSPATGALLAALREGTGSGGLKDRTLVQQTLQQMAQQLRQLQTRFGIEQAAAASRQDAAEARATVDEFVRRLDRGLDIQRRSMDANEARQIDGNDTLCTKEELAKLTPDADYDFVCQTFVGDSNRSNCVLEHPDGSREFLVPQNMKGRAEERQRMATERLLKFCGNDKEKSLVLSRLVNQKTLYASVPAVLFLSGKLDLPADSSQIPAAINNYGFSGSTYLIKNNGNGSYSVSANNYRQFTDIQPSDDGTIPAQQLNSNLSHHEVNIHIEVDADNQPHLAGMEYDFVTAPLLAVGEENEDPSAAAKHFHTKDIDSSAIAAEQLKVDPAGQLQFQDADAREANRLAGDAQALRKAITESDIGEDRKQVLQRRLEFIDDAAAEISRLIESGRAEDAQRAVERAGDLNSDLRLLQQDLKVKFDHWNGQQQDAQLATLAAATFAALGAAAGEIEGTAADRAAALDDAAGNLDAVAAGSVLARAENALAQAEAGVLAISKAIASLSVQEFDRSEKKLLGLMAEANQRHAAAKGNYENALAGNRATGAVAGPGVLGKELRQMQQQMLERLEQGERLPANHPRLSEANLLRIRLERFKGENPALAGALASFDSDFAQLAEQAANNRSWKPIEKGFQDIDEGGNLHSLTSSIVPAKNFAAGFADYGGSDNGVSSHSRTSGLHLSNLASSSLANERGVVFTGLRHGIIDAYTIRPETIAKMPESQLERLQQNTLENDEKWREWADSHNRSGPFKSDLELMRTADGSRVAAERAREVANHNAALELVRAAVVENPVLRQQALAGEDVEVTIDSVSLVTPDYLRGLIGAESEREMQQNQRAALAELSGKALSLEIRDNEGITHPVSVKVDARDFNFGVNSYAVDRGAKVPLFGRLMGWDSADARNSELLQRMLGPLNAAEFGGEVADALNYLENGTAADGMSTQVRSALDGREGDAFADRKLRAGAIRTLASQIRDIYNSGAHRRGGSDPYKLVARLAVLSNLLGHTACYNCKSGKDRTGQLDVEAKMIAHRLAIGETPQPGESVDHIRRTNFALKTGNLEMQQYNSGLAGYKLDVRAIPGQLGSPLAQQLFSGDSASVPA